MNKEYYLNQRNKYLPENLKTIFILESPPVSNKYFYNETGGVGEPLFSALMKLIGCEPQNKVEGLSSFAESGYLIIDATYTPVNRLRDKERNKTILDDFENLVADLKQYTNSKQISIILIKANICRLLEKKLSSIGFNVQNHGRIIPFPSHGQQNKFFMEMRKVIAQ